jgi:hypothetical protein
MPSLEQVQRYMRTRRLAHGDNDKISESYREGKQVKSR